MEILFFILGLVTAIAIPILIWRKNENDNPLQRCM